MKTNFNFNSQICTSRSQSEHLLALGLKKETTDCYWFFCDIAKEWKCTILSSTQVFKDYPTTVIPAWSLHRLLCLYNVHYLEFMGEEEIAGAYDIVIDAITQAIEGGYFNEKYLV